MATKATPRKSKATLRKARGGARVRAIRGVGKVDLREWSLETTDKLAGMIEKAVLKAASEAVRLAFKQDEYDISAEFGILSHYKRRRTTRPLDIYFDVPFADSDDDCVTFAFNLRDALPPSRCDLIEWTVEGEDEDVKYLTQLRDALNALAGEITKDLEFAQSAVAKRKAAGDEGAFRVAQERDPGDAIREFVEKAHALQNARWEVEQFLNSNPMFNPALNKALNTLGNQIRVALDAV